MQTAKVVGSGLAPFRPPKPFPATFGETVQTVRPVLERPRALDSVYVGCIFGLCSCGNHLAETDLRHWEPKVLVCSAAA